ncbi:calcineurin-binding protein cabin-1-like isoform X2 [Sitophilus oryzae]|uniref:Calcineurin-binding protein cabin-1-like isoform X2 n=1 Tax=Sitophilus oryzae TaxID=7048 RepID=A0A6J2Y0Q6_SITOR|nr:calcineurin-binding protein cabin-1-like isoform X2 [Sitophilus oryzae]
MLKIKALNQESSSDEDIPIIGREAQEEVVLEYYNKALRSIAEKNYAVSEQILKELIEENIPKLENNGGLPKSMSTLKYSCYVNLGNTYLSRNNISRALETYTLASELDHTDVTLWTRIGKLALKDNKFRKASYAFSKGLECNESHWPCLDNLISVLFAIKDTISCLVYIGKALMLDPNYTKGLVLRQQLYRDNPATREYYQLYNPDYIWEPPIDVEIEKDEEEEILKDAQKLCDKVNEIEKSLCSKPFKTIPLPRSLDEYTWTALAQTIIYCHQYLTDNEMSHFTFLDLSKCMSQHADESVHSNYSDKVSDEVEDKEKKSQELKNGEASTENTTGPEKNGCEPATVERRFSQTSDNTNGNDNQDNLTPIQTDNDENMELDNDETDGDNGDTANQRGRPKGTKRKRDVLSELQIWGWHSKRKPPKKANKDFTVEDALNRIVPKYLLKNKVTSESLNQGGEDSMNTMDIYNMYVEDKELNFLSPIHSPKSVNFEAYFGTDREKEDVMKFWTKERKDVDVIVLLKELTFELSKLWQYQWPKKLVPLYVQIYNMFREHCDQPQVFCGGHTFEEIRQDALATLLFGELVTFSSESSETILPIQLGYLQLVSNWADQWREEFTSFFIRFHWLQSHYFRKTDQNDLAIRALQLIMEEIETKESGSLERFSLNLPNFSKYGFITGQIIEKIIKHLNMMISLSSVESLFNSQQYDEVIDILRLTFGTGSYSKVGRMGRPAQLGILMHSLWYTNWEQCFIWTEECLYEALQNYGKPNVDQDKWQKIIEKCLGFFLEIIKKETVSIIDKLSEEKRCRLVESLTRIVCIQLNTDMLVIPFDCVTPWILLHYILLREEHRQYANKKHNHCKRNKVDTEESPESVEQELPSSIAILFSAHEFLGPKGWCLTERGQLLHFILDTVLDRLDTPIFEPVRDKIEVHIEQALFCLYLYPSKKNKISRHLVDHNVDPLPLTWERSFQLYQYYAPEILPEFNSFKTASISADLEQLFKRILALMPFVCDLHTHLPKVMDYVHGKAEKIPEPMDFPNKIRAIYYLLGDYYFKEKEFNRCIKYFQLDLCINPSRLDTWACLALSYTAQLESILNFCEKLKNESDFLDKAKSAQICYKKALELGPEDCVLWIECGSFEYMVHAFCSRLIKYESENFSMEKFELLESEKESYLDSSGNSLEHAIGLFESNKSQNEPDERWLQYYILGKIAEKKRKEPTEYLQYYLTATNLLNENNAVYPEKINYNNPQHLSVEALELHYRIHASILKYLEMHEGKDIPNTLGAFFKKCVSTASGYYAAPPMQPEVQQPENPTEPEPITNTVSSTSFQDQFLNSIKNFEVAKNEIDEFSESVVQECLEDILRKVDEILADKETKNAETDKKEEDDCIAVEEVQDVIMISDSEDECVNVEQVDKIEENNEEKRDTVLKEGSEGQKDVQYLLDKMMEQTMKDVDKLDDSDPNNSGTEQIEEVVVKENDAVIPKDSEEKMQVDENPQTSIPLTKPKEKSDSETDTDNRRTSVEEDSSSSSSSSSTTSTDSESDDSDSSSSEETNGNMSHNDISQLVDKCISGLELCITRLPQNYKALYRLAHLYFHYKGRKDYTKCKQLLLGEYKCKDSTMVCGLFSDRKANNFFNNIWRIPSTEIDRPGSLAAHMNRCISLVLQVLRNTNDNRTLMDICMQLRKTPDRDKIYIKESDRDVFSEQALKMSTQSLRSQIKNVENMQNQQIVKLLMDIFRIYQKVQKNMPSKETLFSSMLVEVYKKFIKETVPDTVNILDLAIKFCQQHRPGEKHKAHHTLPSNTNSVAFSRSPGVASPPVHPNPLAMTSNIQKMMKPPSLGRPRGRPPLPKVHGSKIRSPRPKSPASSYAWPSMYESNMAYLKHYQDQLIKQYSQGSSIAQLTQLLQAMSKGQLTNPAVAQAVTNQFLSASNILGPASTSVQQSSSGFKGFNQVPSTTGLNADQIKFLETMLPKHGGSSNLFKPTTSGSLVSKPKHSSGTKTTSASQYPQKFKPKPVFKEPSPTKPCQTSEEKSANIYMKEHPNISITPVTTTSNTILTTSSYISPNTSSKGPYSKPQIPPSTSMYDLPKTSYISPALPFGAGSPSSAKQAPAAHSSGTGANLGHNMPLTPPATSSPSFIKHNTSPGKTLQEKLAEKKKEQLMKNVEVKEREESSMNLLKNLNIPSALSVSPAMTLPAAVSKHAPFSHYPVPPKSTVPNFSMEHKIPTSLTVTSAPSQIPAPKYYPESGISITQVPPLKLKTKSKHPENPLFLKGCSNSPSKPKIKEHSPSTTSTDTSKGRLRVKKDLFVQETNPKQPTSVITNQHSQERTMSPSRHKKTEQEALSAIKKLSSINIIPVNHPTSKKSASENNDVICIVSDDE